MSPKGQNNRIIITSHERWLMGWFALTALAFGLFSIFPNLTETVYGDFCYPVMRWVQFYIFSFFPFPGYWVVWPVLVIGLMLLFFVNVRKFSSGQRLFLLVKRVAVYLGVWASIFYWLWGFNYLRPGFIERSGYEVAPVEVDEVFKMLDTTILKLNALSDHSRVHSKDDYAELNLKLQSHLIRYGYSVNVPVQLSNLPPKGILMRWSSAGIFMPFSGESNVDAAVLPVQTPFTSAHELAHGYGVTDEGVCNFLALLTCLDSKDRRIQYSGWLSFYRYVAYEARKLDKEKYKKAREVLDQSVVDDLVEISENSRKYPDFIPSWRDAVYDRYLKSQGVKEGTESYNKIIMLKAAYDRSTGER